MSDPQGPLVPAYIKKHIEERSLELLQFGISTCASCGLQHEFSGGYLQMLDAYILPSLERNITQFVVRWYCPAEMKREIRYPENWKEALRERWAPRWCLVKWPVKYTVVKIYEMFPEVAWPKNSGHKRNVHIYTSREADAPR